MLVQFKHAWAVLLLTASAAAMVLVTEHEQAIRLWGMVLQMLGVAAVVQELRSTSRHYGRPGIREGLRMAWRSRPGGAVAVDLQATVIGLHGAVAIAGGVQATVISGRLEDRVEQLETQTRALTSAQGKLKSDLDTERGERERAVAAESASRQADIEALDKRVEAVVAGTIHVSMMGVWALVLGVMLASASPELAAARGWLFSG